MRLRSLIFSLSPLLLLGCQPPGYTVIASLEGGRLIFTSRGDGGWPFRAADNSAKADTIEVRDGEHVAWRIEGSGTDAKCEIFARFGFPLAYGATPRCFKATVPATRLVHGRAYEIESGGLGGAGRGRGSFRLGETVENLE